MIIRFNTALIVGAALTALANPARGQTSTGEWSLEDRVIVRDTRTVTGIAATFDRVYIVTPSQVLVRRPQTESWEGPYTPPDPRLLVGVNLALADPLDNSLWMVGRTRWVHFEPDLVLWTAGDVGSTINSAAFDLANPIGGLLVRTGAGWQELPRGGSAAISVRAPLQPVGALSVSQFLRDHPALAGASSAFLMNQRLTSARFTSVAQSFDRLGWYLGTDGAGAFYLREGSALPEPLQFGLAGSSVAAIFAAPGGVWAISERTPFNDAALNFVSADLREFRTFEGPGATGLPFASARTLTGIGRSLWAATDRGVVRMDLVRGDALLLDAARGLPGGRALALMARQGWIGVGTERGAARLSDSLEVFTVAPDFHDAAYAVSLSADTTFIGSATGVWYTLGREGELARLAGTTSAEFQRPVVALEWMGRVLIALTPERLTWRSATGRWQAGPDLSTQVGALRSLQVDGDGVWVVGERGIGFTRLSLPIVRPLTDRDLPGDPRAVAIDADFVWVATSGGLVRFRREALRQ